METKATEIATDIYRLSTSLPIVPGGFTFNQFLVMGDEPLLFHCGMRGLFPSISEALSRIVPLEKLRWISFGHLEGDESGSMNEWLQAAPNATVVHGKLACDLSLNDMASRPPRALQDGDVLDIGGHRLRLLATPHVPHNWEAIMLFDDSTQTLLSGDLFTHFGDGPPVTDSDLVGPAMAAEQAFPGGTALIPTLAPTLRKLADLEPRTIAVMHGSSYAGNAREALQDLAAEYEKMFRAACA